VEDSLCWLSIELFYGQKFVFASRVAQCMPNLILFWTFKLMHLGPGPQPTHIFEGEAKWCNLLLYIINTYFFLFWGAIVRLPPLLLRACLGLLVWWPTIFCNLFNVSARRSVGYSWTIPLRPFVVNLPLCPNPSCVICLWFLCLMAIFNILSCSLGYLRRFTWVNV